MWNVGYVMHTCLSGRVSSFDWPCRKCNPRSVKKRENGFVVAASAAENTRAQKGREKGEKASAQFSPLARRRRERENRRGLSQSWNKQMEKTTNPKLLLSLSLCAPPSPFWFPILFPSRHRSAFSSCSASPATLKIKYLITPISHHVNQEPSNLHRPKQQHRRRHRGGR